MSDHAKADAQMKTLEEIPEAYRDPKYLEAESTRLLTDIRKWEQDKETAAAQLRKAGADLSASQAACRNAEERREELVKKYRETESVLKEASDKAGFQSLDECKEWYKKKDTEESVRKTLEQYRADRKSTEERIKAEEQETAGKERPDMLALNENPKHCRISSKSLRKGSRSQGTHRNAPKGRFRRQSHREGTGRPPQGGRPYKRPL